MLRAGRSTPSARASSGSAAAVAGGAYAGLERVHLVRLQLLDLLRYAGRGLFRLALVRRRHVLELVRQDNRLALALQRLQAQLEALVEGLLHLVAEVAEAVTVRIGLRRVGDGRGRQRPS